MGKDVRIGLAILLAGLCLARRVHACALEEPLAFSSPQATLSKVDDNPHPAPGRPEEQGILRRLWDEIVVTVLGWLMTVVTWVTHDLVYLARDVWARLQREAVLLWAGFVRLLERAGLLGMVMPGP